MGAQEQSTTNEKETEFLSARCWWVLKRRSQFCQDHTRFRKLGVGHRNHLDWRTGAGTDKAPLVTDDGVKTFRQEGNSDRLSPTGRRSREERLHGFHKWCCLTGCA
jgi:hypothetical protein